MYLNWDCNTKGHASKSLKEGTERTPDGKDILFVTILWGCVYCDATSKTRWADIKNTEIDHTKCGGPDNCFGCKAKGLQLATGDASGHIIEAGVTQKKWDKELDFYRDARAQGIQPESTNRKAVEKAIEASEVLNQPYSGETMPKAKDINKDTVAVMKEIGQI